ncbi:hypothetical protein Afil01_17160 [Actinorhabdospora filicis]|uniref:Copper chaperone PCu(A)C n=1 Tax=Actinorhabdospora filicis TaxID=1785913 RepID=A0A9W6W7U1_9ACTN|nr:hypothetical protein [Actinorhabdospora filicis]GLZ76909.1 hypothetical protein Afil01_17160 [Actinorhabdospora filicis]
MTVRVARIGACLAAAAAVVMGVSACGAGQVTQTADTVTAIAGADLTVGDLMLNDVKIDWNGSQGYQTGANADLILRVFNNGTEADRLTAVSVEPAPGDNPNEQSPGAQGVVYVDGPAVTPSASSSDAPTTGGGNPAINVTVLPHGYVMLVPGQGPFLRVNGLTGKLGPGESLWMTFTFERAGTIRAQIPVGLPSEPVDRSKAEFPETGEGH